MPRAASPATKTSAAKAGSAAALRKKVAGVGKEPVAPTPAVDPDNTPLGLPRPRPGLRNTQTPGVYLNDLNTLVDYRGVALSMMQLREKDNAYAQDVLGTDIVTPVDVMKRAALDPTLPMHVRLDAAKNAAPYTNRRMPQAIDGGADPSGGSKAIALSFGDLSSLTAAELAVARKLMTAAAAQQAGGQDG